MNSYEERQQAKAEYYAGQATKTEQAANAARDASHRLGDAIPFGQPILVGHHSEGRARRDHERINSLMGKSIELDEKATYYADKAERLANPTAISSDDPEAINKLKAKLADLEKKHVELKAVPKDKRVWYTLPYSKAEINRTKERITELEQKAALPDLDLEINGIKIKTVKTDNRVRLVFPSIPSEEVRGRLKQNGFRWSPFNGAWQRQISPYALRLAQEIAKEAKL